LQEQFDTFEGFVQVLGVFMGDLVSKFSQHVPRVDVDDPLPFDLPKDLEETFTVGLKTTVVQIVAEYFGTQKILEFRKTEDQRIEGKTFELSERIVIPDRPNGFEDAQGLFDEFDMFVTLLEISFETLTEHFLLPSHDILGSIIAKGDP
jgi:hypothetical protein